jgi:uncharacterized alkaline shock family protein YloU
VHEGSGPSISAEVVTSTVWDAIKLIPGLDDLHRNPLQAFGERVRREPHGPVRFAEDEDGPLLEVHIVVSAGAAVAAVSEAVALAGASYLAGATGAPITHVEVYVDDIADDDE